MGVFVKIKNSDITDLSVCLVITERSFETGAVSRHLAEDKLHRLAEILQYESTDDITKFVDECKATVLYSNFKAIRKKVFDRLIEIEQYEVVQALGLHKQ